MLPSSSLYTIHPNYSADAFSLISRIYILKKKKKRKLSRRRGRDRGWASPLLHARAIMAMRFTSLLSLEKTTVILMGTTSWSLPDGCLGSVFRKLVCLDRNSCSLVCKRWKCVDSKSRNRLVLLARSEMSPSLPSVSQGLPQATRHRRCCPLSHSHFSLFFHRACVSKNCYYSRRLFNILTII